eukprot:6172558-Pleurochrysis_carterae.AAC.2
MHVQLCPIVRHHMNRADLSRALLTMHKQPSLSTLRRVAARRDLYSFAAWLCSCRRELAENQLSGTIPDVGALTGLTDLCAAEPFEDAAFRSYCALNLISLQCFCDVTASSLSNQENIPSRLQRALLGGTVDEFNCTF